jgi:single-strand DNA-binding protein
MSGETEITLCGNLVDDPELRFTPSGAAVAKFRMASTPRTFDRQTNEWKDGESLFLTVNVWRQPAENVAESLHKGMRVIVQGWLKQRSYETSDVGPSLRGATAQVTRANRQNGQQGSSQPSQDPWASQPQNGRQQPPVQAAQGWAAPQSGYSDEPTF